MCRFIPALSIHETPRHGCRPTPSSFGETPSWSPKLFTGFSVFWRNLAWSLFTNRSVLIAGVVMERGVLRCCRRALLFLLHVGSALEVFVAKRLTNQHF